MFAEESTGRSSESFTVRHPTSGCQQLPHITHTTNSHRIKLGIFGRDYTENNYPSLNMKRHFKSLID